MDRPVNDMLGATAGRVQTARPKLGKKPVCALGILAAITFLQCMVAPNAGAMPASPTPIQLTQPDGTIITLRIFGYPEFHWFEDLDGFTVVRKGQQYVYAQRGTRGQLEPTELEVGKVDPVVAGLQPKIKPTARAVEEHSKRLLADPPTALRATHSIMPTTSIKNLVVLCKFADHQFGVHTRDPADYDVLWNAIGGDPVLAPTGSVRDCFLENSYGQVTINSTVAVWVTLPHPEAYYAAGTNGLGPIYPNNAQGMVVDAMEALDPLVDLAEFDVDTNGFVDAIAIIHSGYGAETGGGGGNWIWSHRWAVFQVPGTGLWVSDDVNNDGENIRVFDYHTEPALWGSSGNEISRLGVAAHETGHFLGLPDYYDIDGGGQGAGSWGMMANAWGFDQSQLHPPHFSAYSKMQLGWLTPIVIDQPNRYTVPHVEFNDVVYRINAGYPDGEYLLIENRQPAGIESIMPQGGLAIWHIDESKAFNTNEGYPGQPGWPENNNHYRMALLQADGNFDLERGLNRGDGGDVYHGAGVGRIDGATSPNTDSYQLGMIVPSGNVITDISASDLTMTFVYGDVSTCGLSSDCGDGVFCNGVEDCIAGLCLSPGNPCGVGEFCGEDVADCMPIVFSDDFENGNSNGWTLRGPGSTATQGDWIIGDPNGTDSAGEPAQPADAADGVGCAFTAQNASLGTQDVDNGIVHMDSPPLDLSGFLTAELTFTRWFFNRDVGEDVDDFFSASVSDDGVNWATVYVTAYDEVETNQWTDVSVNFQNFIDLNDTVQIRFSASDGIATGMGSIIEAAVDNVFVSASTKCFADADCDDGDACNGVEICSSGVCLPGDPLDCDDGLFCTGTESCFDSACESSGDPCDDPELPVCDEAADTCVQCIGEDDCPAMEFCTASNTCLAYGDGDFDADGDVDMTDFGFFQACFGSPATPGCEAGNITGDRFIDGDDLTAFVGLLAGPAPAP